MYLDDGIGMRGSLRERDALVNNVKNVDECVFLLAQEKCAWRPTENVI